MEGLYNTLNTELGEFPGNTIINNSDKEGMINNLKKIDQHGYEIIYVLIKTHQKLEGITDMNSLPYEGKSLKSGVKFDIDKLPVKLFYIINIFIDKHIKHLNEDVNRF